MSCLTEGSVVVIFCQKALPTLVRLSRSDQILEWDVFVAEKINTFVAVVLNVWLIDGLRKSLFLLKS